MPLLKRASLIATVAASLVLGACSSSGGTAQPTTTTAPAATSTTVDVSTPTPVTTDYGVGRISLTLEDTSRGTDGNAAQKIEPKDSRTLPVMVLYPAEKPAQKPDKKPLEILDDAPVAEGRFPLFVFSHGVTATGPAYTAVLMSIAAHGYVVAAPTYPLTSGAGGWANVQQVVNQPADVSFVITEMLERSKSSDGPFAGRITPGHVAIGGHSLGAITSLGFYNSCCTDDRISAVIALSGILLPYPDGNFDKPPAIPLLLIHGEKDKTLSFKGGSENIFNKFITTPRALLRYPEGGHVDVVSADPFTARTQAAIRAFLDLELRDDDTEWKKLAAVVEADGVGAVAVEGGLEPPR